MDGAGSLLARGRLLDAMTSATVTFIEAPSGYGKTSLSAQAVDGAQHGAVQVHLLHESDASGLVAQLGQVLAAAGFTDLGNALDSAQPDEALDTFVHMLRQRPDPILVIFDDVHHGDHSAVGWLQRIASRIVVPHRLVIAGRRTDRRNDPRREPTSEFGEGIVEAALRLTATDLCFTGAEVGMALQNAGADSRWVDEVVARTGGWPAAVVLAAERLGRAPNSSPFAAAMNQQSLLDDLLVQLLQQRTPDERRRLSRLASVPRLSPAIAETIAGPGAMRLLLDSGLPTSSVSPGWIEMPDVVRQLVSPAEPIETADARAAARIYLGHDQFAAAIALMRGVNDYVGLATVLAELDWSELERFGQPQLRVALSLIGNDRLAEWPQLLVKASWAAEGKDPTTRRQWLALADSATAAGSPWRPLVDAELAREGGRMGDIDRAVRHATIALDSAGSDDLVARARALLAWGMANSIRCTTSSLAEAEDQLCEAILLFRILGEERWEADALNRLSYAVSFHGGRCVLAEEQMRAAMSLLPAASRERAVMLTYYIDILDHLGRIEEAHAVGREALEIGRRLGDQLSIGFTSWSMAWITAHAGDLDATITWLAEAERHGGRWINEPNGVEFAAAACDMMCMLGDEHGARRFHDQAVERGQRHGLADVVAIATARLEATFGDPEIAEQLLANLDDAPFAVVRSRWIRRLLRATTAHRRGDVQMAQRLVDECWREADLIGLPDLPLRHERRLVTELSMYRASALDEVAARRLTMLGGFSLSSGGHDLTPPPGHPAALVKLLALRGTMSVDETIDLLWPDADTVTGRNRLRNLLNRVKNASGEVVVRRGDSLALDESVETDVVVFETLAARAVAADPLERVTLARLATRVYAGELLPDSRFDDWAVAPRERLRRLFLSLTDLLAADAVRRGEIDEALRHFDVGIANEPLEEVRYARAASLLMQQGRRTTAARMVRAGLDVLDELGVPAGADLTEIAALLGVG